MHRNIHFGSTAAYLVSVEHPCHVPNCMTETEAHTKGSQDSLLRHGILKPNFLDKKRLGNSVPAVLAVPHLQPQFRRCYLIIFPTLFSRSARLISKVAVAQRAGMG